MFITSIAHIFLSRTLEAVQPHPQVVGVEEAVLAHVLELRLVVLGALRRLAQDELSVGRTHSEVAALLVGLEMIDWGEV